MPPPRYVVLTCCGFIAACVSTPNRNVRPHYAQSVTVDSASSTCTRNPAACYAPLPGEESLLPWASRSVQAVRTLSATLRLLEAADVARVEHLLVQCAKDAHFQVNEEELGPGRLPTKAQCDEVVRWEGENKDKKVTRAMDLGEKKHNRALECVKTELGKLYPENVTVEPLSQYMKDLSTGQWRWLAPEQVTQWVREGLTALLRGTLIPDVVLHASGNPNKVQRIYDFKFPCAPTRGRQPAWRKYPEGHPHFPKNQRQMYDELGGLDDSAMVTPQLGILR
jgi:hypothetical protein